jgi:hypothetical protein
MSEDEKNYVDMEYTGPGVGVQEIGELRDDGDGRVNTGDVHWVPEDLANRLLLSSDWRRADGTSRVEALGLEGEKARLEESVETREDLIDPNLESHPAGLTGGEKISDKPYEETGMAKVEGSGSTEFVSPVHARLAEIAAQNDEASPEGEAPPEGEENAGENEQEEVNE